MNLAKESSQWIFSKNLLNESCQWIFSMNLLNETCQCLSNPAMRFFRVMTLTMHARITQWIVTHVVNFSSNRWHVVLTWLCYRDQTRCLYNNVQWMRYFWTRTKCWFVFLAPHSWCSLLGQVSMGNSECDYKKNCNCSTHEQGLRCKAGVNIITDGCACCSMCARQQGDLCNRKDRCDEHKGLKCEMILDGGLRGICRGITVTENVSCGHPHSALYNFSEFLHFINLLNNWNKSLQ